MKPAIDTQVMLLTPEGRGAVASLLVEGPRALDFVGALFHSAHGRPLAEWPCGRIAFGRWQCSETGEELIVCRRSSERIEIHCHGGHAAPAAIIVSLVECGCRAVAWEQWMAESAQDPITAAAQIALAGATTERTASILWEQTAGALRRSLETIAAQLAAEQLDQAALGIEALIENSGVGCHLVSPWRVVLAGRTNVGKSSLINALVGYRRAIVHETPGTTRDVVTAAAAFAGWPVELADTAGLRESNDLLETSGMRLTHERLSTADLAVLVFDASTGLSAEDRRLAERWPRALWVFNKCDLLNDDSLIVAESRGLCVSALRRDGLDALEREIGTRLVPRVPAAEAGVPFTATQIQSLVQIRAALATGDRVAARQLLSRPESWGGDC